MTIDIRSLAYLVAETTDVAAWKNYAENVLGAMTAPTAEGGLHVKIDERQQRMVIRKGENNRLASSGWEVLGPKQFAAAKAHLESKGVAFTAGSKEDCTLRCVQEMVTFKDPAGNTLELVWGFKSDFIHFNSPMGVSRFVTGDQGMGHVVLPLAEHFAAGKQFYEEVLGFEMSDIMNFMPTGPDGPSLPIHFMHCQNSRHHSLAIAAMPSAAGCIHMMFEVPDMPEVGRAYDRMLAHKVKLTATLGQHTNDKMVSFYMKTPSGFDLEYGYSDYTPDWNSHAVHEFTKVSLWGHDFSVGFQ